MSVAVPDSGARPLDEQIVHRLIDHGDELLLLRAKVAFLEAALAQVAENFKATEVILASHDALIKKILVAGRLPEGGAA